MLPNVPNNVLVEEAAAKLAPPAAPDAKNPVVAAGARNAID